ncbi:Os04g0136016, partial [Oryza sativa Japonica Group]
RHATKEVHGEHAFFSDGTEREHHHADAWTRPVAVQAARHGAQAEHHAALPGRQLWQHRCVAVRHLSFQRRGR